MSTKVHFENIKKTILNEIGMAKVSIDIAVAWITEPEIISNLIALLKQNIKIRILTFDDRINNINRFKKLYYSGAEIRMSKNLMHNKFCVVDNNTVISGSFNWTIKASSNDENITIIKDEITLIEDFKTEFQNLWNKCENIDSKLKVSKEHLKEIESEFKTTLLKKFLSPIQEKKNNMFTT